MMQACGVPLLPTPPSCTTGIVKDYPILSLLS